MSASEPVRIGVIGAGAMPQLVHLPLLSERSDVKLVALADADPVKLKALGERFEIPHLGSDTELIEHDDIDALLIHTPNHLREELAVRALKGGKHVFAENPVAMSSEGAARVMAVAEAEGLSAQVGLAHRFRPDVSALRAFVHGGQAGRIYAARAAWMIRALRKARNSWRSSGEDLFSGALADLGVRALDLLMWILDEPEVRSVYALRSTREEAAEDAASLLIETADGAALSLEVSWSLFASEDRHYARVLGTEGSGQIEPLELFHRVGGRPIDVTPDQTLGVRVGNRFLNAQRREHDYFLRAVRGHGERIDHPEQVTVLRILEAAYTSAREGRSVALEG